MGDNNGKGEIPWRVFIVAMIVPLAWALRIIINEVRKISLMQDSERIKLLGRLLLVSRNQMHGFNA